MPPRIGLTGAGAPMDGRRPIGKVRLRVSGGSTGRACEGNPAGSTAGLTSRGVRVPQGRFGDYLGRIVAPMPLMSRRSWRSSRRPADASARSCWRGGCASRRTSGRHGRANWHTARRRSTSAHSAWTPRRRRTCRRRLARRFGAVAVRTTGDTLVVATAEAGLARASRRLGRLLGKKVRYVIAPPEQIAVAIDRYYPAAAPIATPTGSAGPAQTVCGRTARMRSAICCCCEKIARFTELIARSSAR